MNIIISPVEARIIGCLIEKQATTPDQYPLSLNALTNACNQKSNREPVMELTEAEVQAAVDTLRKKYLVSDRSAGYGGRVVKYHHRFCNTEFGSLKFDPGELGIIDVMLLRGPQTPGELRTRAARFHDFADTAEVEQALQRLMTREDGPFVARLARSPGERESRYVHLFEGPVDSAPEEPVAMSHEAPAPGLAERIALLEQQVAELQAQVRRLAGGP